MNEAGVRKLNREIEKSLASSLLSSKFSAHYSSISEPKLRQKQISSRLLAAFLHPAQLEAKNSKPYSLKESSPPKKESSNLWAQCFLNLSEEFLQEREKLLRLNPSRRKLVQEHLIKLSKTKENPSLKRFIESTPSDPLYKGMQFFSWEITIFYMFEFLLLKRWVDQGEIDKMPESPSQLSGAIRSHIKERSAEKVLQLKQWHFLNINIYSWYQPGKHVWLDLKNLARKVNISKESIDFVRRILLKEKPILKRIGMDCNHGYTELAWELLLKQRQLDERVTIQKFPSIHRRSSSIVAGLSGGQALSSLQNIASTYSMPSQIYALADTNLEIFLGEMLYLWNAEAKDFKSLKIELIERNKRKKEAENLFSPHRQSILNELRGANHAAIFLEEKAKTNLKKGKIPSLIRYLSNHGLILLSGKEYWPLSETKESAKIRRFILNNCSIRFIVDLQQLTIKQGKTKKNFPQCICVLEKNNSKELRDKNRPLIIKIRGSMNDEKDLKNIRAEILKHLEDSPTPCETQSYTIPSTDLRLDMISAATTQGRLDHNPWIHLTDPNFYAIVHQLNNYPKKLGQYGTLLPFNQNLEVKNGIFILEILGKALYSCSEKEKFQLYKDNLDSSTKTIEYSFLLDQNIKEAPAFFSALINSAPTQLWYRLNWEQRSCSTQKPLSKDILKLIPALGLLSLIAEGYSNAQLNPSPIVNMDYADNRISQMLQEIHSNPSRKLEKELYEYIIKLEQTIQIHLNLVKEYSQHLCADAHIHRWNIPQEPPPLSPRDALLSLSHLKQAPLCRHPNFHIAFTEKIADFMVNSYELSAGENNMAELDLHDTTGPMLVIRSSPFLVEAILPEIKSRLGRPWEEISQRIFLPVDMELTQNQIRNFQHSLREELKSTLKATQLLDSIFSKLLCLDSNAMDVNAVTALINRQLSPKSNTYSLKDKKEELRIFEQDKSFFQIPKN